MRTGLYDIVFLAAFVSLSLIPNTTTVSAAEIIYQADRNQSQEAEDGSVINLRGHGINPSKGGGGRRGGERQPDKSGKSIEMDPLHRVTNNRQQQTDTTNTRGRKLWGIQINGVLYADNDNLRERPSFEAGMEAKVTSEECVPLEVCTDDKKGDDGGLECYSDDGYERSFSNKIINMSENKQLVIRMAMDGPLGFDVSYALPSGRLSPRREPLFLDYVVSGNYCIHIYILDGKTGTELAYIHRIPGAAIPVRPSTMSLPNDIFFGSHGDIIID